MNKIINSIVISLSLILVGFVMICSMLPNFILNTVVTIGGFLIPTFIIITTMIIEIKKETEVQGKSKIRSFWLKILFIIYCLFTITILFLNNEYRFGGSVDIGIFSKEHLKWSTNVIPFATMIGYINKLISQEISKSVVIINLATNLLLFAPIGFFIPMLYKDKIKNTTQFIIMMIIITLVIEILQFVTYRGAADIDDIILNTVGAIIVYFLMKSKFVNRLLAKILDIPN